MVFDTDDGGFISEEDRAKRREVARKTLLAFSAKVIREKELTG